VLVLLVVFGFGAPGVGEYVAQVDEPHRRVAAVQGHPRRAAGRADDARVEGGGRDLAVAICRSRDAAVAASALRADCSRRAVGKQNRSGIVSAVLVPACSA
jgi:hypothetical protein